MAIPDFTGNPKPSPHLTSNSNRRPPIPSEPAHDPEQPGAKAQSHDEHSGVEDTEAGARADDACYTIIDRLQEAIEHERSQLMVVESLLGCLQVALDPEAVKVEPLNKSINRLDPREIQRLISGTVLTAPERSQSSPEISDALTH